MQLFLSKERSRHKGLTSWCLKFPSQASTKVTWSQNIFAPFALKTSPKYQHLSFFYRLSFESQLSSRFSFPGWKVTEQGRQSTVSTKSFGGHWNTSLKTAHIWSITTTTEIQFLLSVISEIRQKGKHTLANSPEKPLASISQDVYSFSYKFLVLVLSPHAF